MIDAIRQRQKIQTTRYGKCAVCRMEIKLQRLFEDEAGDEGFARIVQAVAAWNLEPLMHQRCERPQVAEEAAA